VCLSLSLAPEESPARVIVLPVRVFVIHADEEQVESGFLLGVVVRKSVSVFEFGIGRLTREGDSVASQGLHDPRRRRTRWRVDSFWML